MILDVAKNEDRMLTRDVWRMEQVAPGGIPFHLVVDRGRPPDLLVRTEHGS